MNKHRNIDKEDLWRLADEYCDECIDNLKTVVASYKTVKIEERMLPTVKYFINHWIRRERPDFYCRTYFYDIMRDDNHPLSDTIKRIDDHLKALGENIVANEGKGIFYAKNALNMTDHQTTDSEIKVTIVRNNEN